MKKQSSKKFLTVVLCALCCALAVCGLFNVPQAHAYRATTTAKGAVLMEAGSRRVLFSRNPDAKMPMASCTKIMTALVAIESGELDKTVEVRPEACGVEGSSVYLRPKEKLTLKELLYGLMLQSGNDCAVAIAYELAGGVENFADMMNNRAKELGANNTNFVTPNGLHDDNHYTTAYDLGLIACQALSNQAFREIVGTKSVKISNEGFDYQRVITNKNKLLGRLDGADGVKTGYTKKAGRCFVGSATRDGMSLVCVVLNCAPMFEESAELIEYGFENYALKRILPKNKMLGLKTDGKSNLVYTCAEGFSYPLRKDGSEDNKISVLTDTENGKLEIKFDNELIFSSTIGIININD